jgi:hypothetical protein
MKQPPSSDRSWLGFNTIVAIGVFWALLTFYLALAFGQPLPGQELPKSYLIASYLLEEGAYLGAALLCLRNWRCRVLVSDCRIWFFLGVGTLLFCLANVIFAYWDLVLERAPDVSLADPVYVISYPFLLWGMLLAIASRGLYLKAWQWVILIVIAAIAIGLAWQLATPWDDSEALRSLNASLDPVVDRTAVPAWVLAVEKMLEPLILMLSLLYIINDVFLLIMAATLLLNFWGGRFARTWTLIALAALLLYIADIRYAYVVMRGDYTENIVDTFWTFSAILFGIGAAWEHNLSIRPYRRRR